MRVLMLNEASARELFQSLNIHDELKTFLGKLIVRYDTFFVNFVYSMFCFYTQTHVSVNSCQTGYSEHELQQLISAFTRFHPNLNLSNILISDRFDMLYGIGCTGYTYNPKFHDDFYEEIYNRLEEVLGVKNAYEKMEEVTLAIEQYVGMIETNLLTISDPKMDSNKNLVYYLELKPTHLIFYIQ